MLYHSATKRITDNSKKSFSNPILNNDYSKSLVNTSRKLQKNKKKQILMSHEDE